MKEHYAELLDTSEWDLFCTLTTKHPLKVGSARGMMNDLGRVIKAPRQSQMFWITEAFNTGEGHHIHALIKTELPGEIIKGWWQKKYGRCAVGRFDKSRRGTDYVTKYIEQKQNDYDFVF